MKMISGLSQPTSGEIEMFGYKNAQLKNVRSRISCLIESPGLYGNMSAYDNLAVKCRLFGINDKRYIENILKTVGLSNVGKKKTKHFSLGMKQRLGIGMALVGEPDLLLLDEHTAALDPKTADKVLQITEEIVARDNLTTLMVTHNMKNAIQYGNRLIMMDAGRVVVDIRGEEKKNLTVSDLLEKFNIENDRMLLSE